MENWIWEFGILELVKVIGEIFGCASGKVLEYIVVMRRPYTQKEICQGTGLSKPTVGKVFDFLLDSDMITKYKSKYKTNFESPAVDHIRRFGLSLAFHFGKKLKMQMVAKS